MQISGLYCITDSTYNTGMTLLEKARACILAGVPILQYRNKSLAYGEQLQEARQLSSLCRQNQTIFLVNDDPLLALECEAHGVHLGQADAAIYEARKILGDDSIIGQTCHGNIELARQAEGEGADYVAFGRFFPSRTKPAAPPANLSVIPQAKKHIKIPVVAIGGINRDNFTALLHAGADAIAVIEDVMSRPDPGKAAKEFNQLINEYRQ